MIIDYKNLQFYLTYLAEPQIEESCLSFEI